MNKKEVAKAYFEQFRKRKDGSFSYSKWDDLCYNLNIIKYDGVEYSVDYVSFERSDNDPDIMQAVAIFSSEMGVFYACLECEYNSYGEYEFWDIDPKIVEKKERTITYWDEIE